MLILFSILMLIYVGLEYFLWERKNWRTYLSFALVGMLLAGVFYAFNDVFMSPIFHWTHWLHYIFWALVIMGCLSWMISFGESYTVVVAIALAAIIYIVGFFGDKASTPQDFHFIQPVWCDEPQFKQLARTALIRDTDLTFKEEVDPNHAIQVSPSMVNSYARRAVPKNIASLVNVSNQLYQVVNGKRVAVVSLSTPNSFVFYSDTNKNLGVHYGEIPGVIVVDALNKDASVAYDGSVINKYVDGIYDWHFRSTWFDEHDWLRYVTRTIARPNGWIPIYVGPQLSDDGQLYQTVLMITPEVNLAGIKPVAFTTMNVSTGKIDTYSLSVTTTGTLKQEFDTSKIPEWIDVIFPSTYFYQVLSWWGDHSQYVACSLQNNANKWQIDSIEDVFTSDNKSFFQITMTSYGNDSVVTHMFYANQRTGAIESYQLPTTRQLPIIESIYDNFAKAVEKRYPKTNAQIEEVEYHMWNGEFVATAIVTTSTNNGSSYVGFGFVLLSGSANLEQSNYIIADSPQDAYTQFLTILANRGSTPDDKSKAITLTQVTGKIARIGSFMDGDKIGYSFLVVTDTNEQYWFVSEATPEVAILREGDIVTVSATVIDKNAQNRAISITSNAVPSK